MVSYAYGNQNTECIAAASTTLKPHAPRIPVKMSLITGVGRSGTTNIDCILKRAGFSSNHEIFNPNGEIFVSWAAGNLADYPTKTVFHNQWHRGNNRIASYIEKHPFNFVIHLVRHPLLVIASWTTVTDLSFSFVVHVTPSISNDLMINLNSHPNNKLSIALLHWVDWNKRIEKVANVRWQMESLNLRAECHRLWKNDSRCNEISIVSTSKNHRDHKTVTWIDLIKVDLKATVEAQQLCRKYGYVGSILGCGVPRYIWIYWHSVELPITVYRCVQSWKVRNPTWEVIVVTDVTLEQYVDPSDAVIIKRLSSKQSTSDLIRIALLNKHGGVYADADVYNVISLDQWIDSYVLPTGFWVPSLVRKDRQVVSWFMASVPSSIIVRLWKSAIFAHAKQFGKFKNYFQLYYTHAELLKTNVMFREQWEMTPKISATISNNEACCTIALPHTIKILRYGTRHMGYLGPVNNRAQRMLETGAIPIIKGMWDAPNHPLAEGDVAFIDYLDALNFTEMQWI